MDPTTNPIIILIASLFPLIIAVVKQTNWSPQVNALIALVMYIVAGIVGTFLAGIEPTQENLTQFISTFVVIGTVAYKLVWANLGQTTEKGTSFEQRLEARTTIAA